MRMPGVRFARRPETDDTPAFDLSYVRSGPVNSTPVLVIPGGPGIGSVLPYHSFRRHARRCGLDALMVEHRGVGLSRSEPGGTDLPAAAMMIRSVVDDIAAVLDAENIDQAIIYGSSYGSYLAQAVGVWHPNRVAGMVLDSTMTSACDYRTVREHARRLLWEGRSAETAPAARLLRSLVSSDAVTLEEASTVARIVYEFAGPQTLHKLVAAKARGRASRLWRWIAGLGARELNKIVPFVMEFDLVARIAFRELNYAPEPDGVPFDPVSDLRAVAARYEPFAGEPLDLPAHWADFTWPLAVLSGERDLRTPRPLAEQVVEATPRSALIALPATGHSALDSHVEASLAAISAIRDGTHTELGANPARIAGLRRRGASRYLGTIIKARLACESLGILPSAANGIRWRRAT